MVVVGVLLSAGHGRMVSVLFLSLCFKYPPSISLCTAEAYVLQRARVRHGRRVVQLFIL